MTKVKFQNDNDLFYDALKLRVNQYFVSTGKSRFADNYMVFKICFFLGGTVFSFCLMFVDEKLLMGGGFIFGVFSFLSALNVSHDAAHNAISRHRSLNTACLYILNLIGVNSYIWKLKHLGAHHTFPNVCGTDSDIGESRIGRLIPAAKRRRFSRFQHFYIPFMYLFYSAHWVLFKDFVQFKTLSVPNRPKIIHPVREYVILLLGKCFALGTTIVLPYLYFDLTILQTCLVFLTMHLGPGIMVAIFLVPAHLNNEVTYPQPDENGLIHSTWAHHQVITAMDYSTDSKLLNFLLGGFNHHIAHHLFPWVCHCHYPKITPMIAELAKQYGVTYRRTDYYGIFKSHIAHLRKMGLEDSKGHLVLNKP